MLICIFYMNIISRIIVFVVCDKRGFNEDSLKEGWYNTFK
jgi:hypothetical protein